MQFTRIVKMPILISSLLLSASPWLLAAGVSSDNHTNGTPEFLHGSVFEKVGIQERIDPLLLYVVAIAESGTGRGGNTLAPHPWVIRSSRGPQFFDSKEAAVAGLALALEASDNIDVGMIQRNLYWHPTSNPEDMLDPYLALSWAAKQLNKTMGSTNDLALGIGRYHNWADQVLAKSYGIRILQMYKNLENQN